MATVSVGPLSVLAAEPPRFTTAEAEGIAAGYYGLDASATELVSERDRNFLLRTADGREFVLKIANAAEERLVTDCQIEVLAFLEAQSLPVSVPRLVLTSDGRKFFLLRSPQGSHVVRLVTWLDGVPLESRRQSPRLCRNFGACAAALNAALAGFEHPGSAQSLMWNMNNAAGVREILHYIGDDALRARAAAVIDDFESRLLPLFADLRSQVIHNDLNLENVLVDPADEERVVGVIDFGDMASAPLVVDVAVAASYLRDFVGNPLLPIARFVGAWHSVLPLERREIDLVFDLIRVRLATTVSVLHWRRAERGPDDPYLGNSAATESTAPHFLGLLDQIPRELAKQTLRQACASVEVAAGRAVAP